MDRMDRGDNDAQRAKLIFLMLAAAVAILLLGSLLYANKARSERNALRQELEACKQDNEKLNQWLQERTQESDALKKQLERLQAKSKAKPAAKSKTGAKSGTKKKTSKTTKSR